MTINNKNKEFLEIAVKELSNLIKSIEDSDDLLNIKIVPSNMEEAAMFLKLDLRLKDNLTTQDFLANIKYYAYKANASRHIGEIIKEAYFYDVVEDSDFEEEYNVFKNISSILHIVQSGLQKYNISLRKVFNQLNIREEMLNHILSGTEEDFVALQKSEFSIPTEAGKVAHLIFMCIYAYFLSLNSSESDCTTESPSHYVLTKKLKMILMKKFNELRSLYFDKYCHWKNYCSDNLIQFIHSKTCEDEVDSWLERMIFGMTIDNAEDTLDHYFHIINSPHLYSDKYRNKVINFLKLDRYSVIRPYYNEYCRKHNIPTDKAYYIGASNAEVVEKQVKRLLVSENKKPDADETEHFGLTLELGKIEEIYNRLVKYYISSDTDINLFCYRLTGKNRPEGELPKIDWIADIKSLVLFIRKLVRQKYGSWKKTCAFFCSNSKMLSDKTLRVTASRIFDSKGLISEERNIVELDEVLDTILNQSK